MKVSYKNKLINLFLGASPKIHGSKPLGTKQPWNLSNMDIDRSNPRNLHIGLNKPETNMKTQDIDGTKP